jgi:predicted phosphodiesterase
MGLTKQILLLSDLHVGSLWGLWPPGFETIDDRFGDAVKFTLNTTQKNLWKHWQKMINSVNPDCIILNGDLIDGLQWRERGRGLVTPNLSWQIEACIAVLDTLPKCPMYFTQGTGYHELEDGRPVEKAIADDFDGQFGDELIVEECGIRLFCRHHIGASQSTWQYMTTAPARDHMLLYLNKSADKYGAIDVAVFSHRHSFVAACYVSGMALVTPCWQTKTPYAVKKGIVSPPDIGWVTLNIDNRRHIAIDRNGITHLQRPCKIVGRDRK